MPYSSLDSSIDIDQKTLTVESLKKRKRGIYRQIPISNELVTELNEALGLNRRSEQAEPLWTWSRRTASRRIKSVMSSSKIVGIQACPKGLRHSFAVHGVLKGIPLILLKRWMGHAYLQTTEIYLNIIGQEERAIAAKLWS